MVQLVRLEEPIPKEKIEELRELLGRAYVGPGKLEVSVYLSQRRVEEPGTVITADVVMKVLEGDIIVPKEHVKWIARYIADVLNLPEDIEETLVTIADAAYDFFGVGEIEFVLFPSLRVFNSAVSKGVLEVAEVKWETPGILNVSVPSFGSLGGTLEPGTFTEKYVLALWKGASVKARLHLTPITKGTYNVQFLARRVDLLRAYVYRRYAQMWSTDDTESKMLFVGVTPLEAFLRTALPTFAAAGVVVGIWAYVFKSMLEIEKKRSKYGL